MKGVEKTKIKTFLAKINMQKQETRVFPPELFNVCNHRKPIVILKPMIGQTKIFMRDKDRSPTLR